MTRTELLAWLETVPEDEPVFCLRAKDDAATHGMNEYRQECIRLGSPRDHKISVFDFIEEFEDWRYVVKDCRQAEENAFWEVAKKAWTEADAKKAKSQDQDHGATTFPIDDARCRSYSRDEKAGRSTWPFRNPGNLLRRLLDLF